MQPLQPEEWDRRFRTALTGYFPPESATVREIHFRGSHTETAVEIIFADTRRPEVVFGLDYDAGVWLREDFEHAADDPEWVVSMMWANFYEAVQCSDLSAVPICPDGIGWLK